MNKLKKSLKENKITYGTWIQIPHPSIVEIIATVSQDSNSCRKFEWICVDMEHGSIDIESMTNLIRTIEKYDLVPVVRIPKNDYVWIHRALDAGAKGLIIPMIKTAKEAEQAVTEALYPPLGKRSFGYSRANVYGKDFNSYIKTANDEISIIIQIEHIDAIEQLDFILNVPGIDATFIGPYDLSGSMGVSGDFESDEYSDALSFYISRSDSNSIPKGIHIVRPTDEQIKFTANVGYKMIAVGTDAVFLQERIDQILKDI